MIFLNIIHFFVELFAIASIPLLATAFLDPDILVNKMPYLKNLIIKDNILIILSSAVCVTFSIKALFYIWLIYFQEKFYKKIKISISTKIFNFYLKNNYHHLFNVGPHFLSRNLTYDLQGLRAYLFSLNNFYREILAFLVIFIITAFVNLKIALVISFTLLVISFFIFDFLKLG